MEEDRDADGVLRLVLLGELDLTVAERLATRLAELRLNGTAVRLDLSQLEFIDSSGIRVVILAALDARQDGWGFQLAPELSPTVRRPVELLGMESTLWPEGR